MRWRHGRCLIERTELIRRGFSLRGLRRLGGGRQKHGDRTIGDLPSRVSGWREQEAKNHNQVDAQR